MKHARADYDRIQDPEGIIPDAELRAAIGRETRMDGIPSWAVRGAKVVFTGKGTGRTAESMGYKVNTRPVVGSIYTIRDTIVGLYGLHVRLTELRVDGHWPDGRPFTDAWGSIVGFRPLVTKSAEQDIALFRHHLDGVGVPA